MILKDQKRKETIMDQINDIKELYKCHFTAKETAEQMKISYAVISNIYRGLKVAGIIKYDRLILKEVINDAR